jgi:hypothetical protein
LVIEEKRYKPSSSKKEKNSEEWSIIQSIAILIFANGLKFYSMASSARRLDDRTQREQQEATIRSIDETKDNIRRAIEETRREVPRFSQTVTDLQNETVDASRDITDTFLDSQKDVINLIQSTWRDIADRTGYLMGWMQPWNWWTGGMSPRDMTDMYARMVSSATENFAAGTRMATNMMFAGAEAARVGTRYARDNAREMSKMTSNTAKVMGHITRETVRVQTEGGGPTAGAGAGAGTTAAGEEGPAKGEAGTRRK